MAIIAWKFVKHEVGPLDNLKGAKVYDLKVKCMNGEKLTREEKDWLARELSVTSYWRSALALMGWMFDFRDYLNRYIVCQYDHWQTYYAPDRTSLRRALYGRIQELHELPKAA